MDLKVAGKYRLVKKLGEGSFGTVFQGTNIKTGEDVAIKLENQKAEINQLHYEYRVLKVLEAAGCNGIVRARQFL
jgi:serine/threonine protein kinase